MLYPRMNFTGIKFIRLLRHQNISLSMFAVTAKVDFNALKELKSSEEIVPHAYVKKLKDNFDVNDDVMSKFEKVA